MILKSRLPQSNSLGRIMAVCVVMAVVASQSFAQENTDPRELRSLEIGKVFDVYSQRLHERRSFSVSLPSSYDRSVAEYPLIIVLDGEYYLPLAAQTVRFLSQFRLMPEAVVVGVHNTDRRLDLTPPDIVLPDVPRGRADSVLAFLGDELIPLLDRSYRLLPLRVLIGHSHGALFDLYALAARPELFRWHVAIDAPVHLADDRSDTRIRSFFQGHSGFVGRLISIERTFGWGEDKWKAVLSSAPRGYRLSRISLPDETHETMIYRGFYEGLQWLFRDLAQHNDSLATLNELRASYQKLSEAYGYEVPVPRSMLIMGAEDLLFAGRAHQAAELLEEFKRVYGTDPQLDELETWTRQLAKEPLPEPFDVLLAYPAPSAQDIRPYLGT